MYRRIPKFKAMPEPKAPPVARQFPTMGMTVDEMAEELHISRPNAYELVKQPGFPAFRVGKRLIVNRAALQRWMDDQVSQPMGDTTSTE